MRIIRKLRVVFSFVVVVVLFGCNEAMTSKTEQTTSENTTTGQNSDPMDLEIHFIDVGQADSIYIKLPNDEHVLIDAGNNSDGDLVVDYLEDRGVVTLNHVIGTHPHEDHIGGLDDVINHFNIEDVYLPNKSATTKTFEDVLTAIDAKNLTITRAKKGVTLFGEQINDKLLEAVMLSPISESYSETNDYSPVIKLTYGDTAYIFTGDAETEVEEEILDGGADLHADVLKLGHHGSITSTSEAFLNAISPTIGIISVGEGNKYGHPNQEIIDRLMNNNVQVYRTDEAGTIIVKSNGTKIEVGTKNSTYQPNPVETTTEDNDVTTTTEEINEITVVINEVLPAPKTVYTKEWIELYNTTSSNIDISGYILDDIEDAGSKPYTIPEGTIIEANKFYIIEFSRMFNNEESDDVRLLNSDGVLIDSFTYSNTEIDSSWYRITNGGPWSDSPTDNPTPNESN
ncbi:lamin tail domain-containing protein [Mycoplasmatota bacterium]|nr:lamin tail domain-containing protein [Mycoplasmatota bacterium]